MAEIPPTGQRVAPLCGGRPTRPPPVQARFCPRVHFAPCRARRLCGSRESRLPAGGQPAHPPTPAPDLGSSRPGRLPPPVLRAPVRGCDRRTCGRRAENDIARGASSGLDLHQPIRCAQRARFSQGGRRVLVSRRRSQSDGWRCFGNWRGMCLRNRPASPAANARETSLFMMNHISATRFGSWLGRRYG
jgi:hypothetical protein